MTITNEKLGRLVLLIISVGVAHIGEQLLFGIEEYHRLIDTFDGWYAMFPEDRADHASMMLLTLILTLISLMFYATIRGGIAGLLVIGALGSIGLKEAYHWYEAIQAGGYVSGLATSVAYVWIGLLIKIEVGRRLKLRLRSSRIAAALRRMTAPVPA